MSIPGALLAAQFRTARNRISRQAGLGGEIATWVMLVVIAGVLFFPALLSHRLGRDLGAELAASGDAEVLRNWNGLMAVCTIGFPILGAFRHRSSFPPSRFGHYPLRPVQVLIADLPAAFFEVFPLLAGTAVAFMNLGLASRMPSATPAIAFLTACGLVMLISLTIIGSSLRELVARSRTLMTTLAAGLALAVTVAGLEGLRVVLREWTPRVAQSWPLASGYAGLVALGGGRNMEALGGFAAAGTSALLLLLLAARLQYGRLLAETGGTSFLPQRDRSFSTASANALLGRAYLAQVLGSAGGRAHLFLPLLYTGSLALVVALARDAIAHDRVLPPELVATVARLEPMPLYGAVPIVAIAMNPQFWMNQFGWDRGGVRALLAMPLSLDAIFAGKARGLAILVSWQTAIGVVPLLTVRLPRWEEIAGGVGAAVFLVLLTAAVGHFTSVRFPRRVDDGRGAQVPLHLSWIPLATMASGGGLLAASWALTELIVRGGGAVALLLAGAAAAAVYRALLPRLSALVEGDAERLVAM